VFDFAAPDAKVPSDIPFPLPPLTVCGVTDPPPLGASAPVRDNAWADLRTSGLLKPWGIS
jgi:hypothetical protein